MELQVHFKGTPAEFGVVVDVLETKVFLAERSSPFSIFQAPKPDANPVYVQLFSPAPDRRYIGDITAQKTPSGSILFIQAKNEDWDHLQPAWKMIRDVLEQQGWIDPAPTPDTARNRSGRPRNALDDWAWEQVNVHGQVSRTVFLEWRRRNQDIGRDLVDEERSFRHAIDPRRHERKKRKQPE